MVNPCKMCGVVIPKSAGKSPFCSPICRLVYTKMHSNRFPKGYCAACGASATFTTLSAPFCRECKKKINEMGIDYIDMFMTQEKKIFIEQKLEDISFTEISNEYKKRKKQMEEERQLALKNKERQNLAKSVLNHDRDGRTKVFPKIENFLKNNDGDKKDTHDTELLIAAKHYIESDTGKFVKPSDLNLTENTKANAEWMIDNKPGLSEIEKKNLSIVVSEYNTDEDAFTQELVDCYACPASSWNLSKYFYEDQMVGICMIDLVKWRYDYLNTGGEWIITFNGVNPPKDTSDHDCRKCPIGNTKWIPRYDDFRGWYKQSPIEFQDSFGTLCKELMEYNEKQQ